MSDPSTPLPDVHVQAEVLVQALPHMQRYDQQVVVIKYGGHAMGDRAAAAGLRRGRGAARAIGRSSRSSSMAAGRRSARCWRSSASSPSSRAACASRTQATVEVVEMVLAGSINKQIVGWIGAEGGKAVGLSGKDGNMVIARKATRTADRPGFQHREGGGSRLRRRAGEGRTGRSGPGAQAELIPVLAPVATRPGRPDLQRQCGHLRRRHRRRHDGQAPPAAHRRSGRSRQERSSLIPETDRSRIAAA